MLLSLTCWAQQDPQYSQYMFNQLAINPAYSGSKQALSTVLDLRKQWTSMPGSPATGSFSMHGQILNSLGVGGHVITENIGPTNWTAAYADLAYHFRIGKGKLSLGFSAGMVNYHIDMSKLDYKDAGELILNYTGARTVFDASAGFYYYSRSFYIGGSITHITNPVLYKDIATQSTAYTKNFNLMPHSFLYVGKGFQLSEGLVFNPSIMLKMVQPNNYSADVNLNFLIKNRVWLGASVRFNYGFVGLMQVYVTNKFKVGYAYDHGLGILGAQAMGSHEILLSYDFISSKSKMLSPRFL